MYRDKVSPEMGGKVPESYINREEWNKLDASGLKVLSIVLALFKSNYFFCSFLRPRFWMKIENDVTVDILAFSL